MRLHLFFVIFVISTLHLTPSFAGGLSFDEAKDLINLLSNRPLNEINSGVPNVLNYMKKNLQNQKAQVMEELEKLSSQSKPGDNFYERYGSVAGNEYFQTYYREIIEPVLTEFFTIIRTSAVPENHRSPLYHQIVKWLGQERGLVADNTSTENARKFGKLLNHEYLMDPVFHASFPNWNTSFRLALLDDIKNNWKNLYKIIIKNEQKDFVYPIKIEDIPKPEQFIYLKKQFKYGFRCTERMSESWEMCKKLQWFIKIDDPSEDPLNAWIVLEIYSHKAFQYTTFTEFKEALLATDENKALSIGVKVIHPLYAVIGNRQAADFVRGVEKLVSDSLTTILSESPLTENELKEELAKLLRFFSVASTFSRGQAAITDWLLKSLARARGYELTFSEKWQGPKYPNPDMHALMEYDIETLIRNFKANTQLRPRLKD